MGNIQISKDRKRTKCNGWAKLINFGNQSKIIRSSDLVSETRYSLRPDYINKPRNYRFKLAKLFGNCCWKIWNRYRRGGRPFTMATPNIYQPGWTIKSVELVRNCDLE